MRVAIVQEFVDPNRGGAETSTLEMADHLAAFGAQVTIVCRPPSGELPARVACQPIAAHGFTRLGRTYQFLKRAAAHLRAARYDIVHAITPILAADVYQPRGGTYHETVERTLATTRSPIWRELKRFGRYFNLRQRFLARIEQMLLGKYQQRIVVAALSEYVRRQVVEAGFVAERTRIIFNGILAPAISDAERRALRNAYRATLGLADDDPMVLFVAHNFRLKGLREAIQAVARQPVTATRRGASTDSLHDATDSLGLAANPLSGATDLLGGPANSLPDATDSLGAPADSQHPADRDRLPEIRRWTLVVAGRDRPRSYRRLARSLGVAEQVRFVGATTAMPAWFAAADVLLHPTWYDPCSRVVLEALAHGLPVVTTRYNGAAEAMLMSPGGGRMMTRFGGGAGPAQVPGQAGQARASVQAGTYAYGAVVAEPRDINALAGGLSHALRPEVQLACRNAASALREQLSMSRHARELLALYEELQAARPRRRAVGDSDDAR